MKIIVTTAIVLLSLIFRFSAIAQEWSLEQCLQYAEQHNKDLLAQEEAVQASISSQQASLSGLLPEITGRAEMNHYWQIPVQAFPAELVGGEPGTFVPVRISTPWTASFGADASLKLIDPQTWQSVKLSSLQVQMAEGELHSLKQQLLKNVRMSFHHVQSEKENLHAVRQLYDSYVEIHRLITLQYEKGITDQITFNQSLTLLNDRLEGRAQAGIALRAAYLDLKFWMGYPLNDSLTIQEDAEMPELHLYEFNATQLPDYNLRSLQQIQAEQQWKVSRSRMLPNLSAVAGFQRVAFRNSFDFFEGGEWYNVGSIGLKLNIPILSLRQMLYEPAQQKAQWKQASYQFDRYQEEQERVFQQEMMQLEQAYEVWQNQQENLRLARQNEILSMSKIEKGIIDMLQLRQIQDDLYRVQQRLSQARLDYLQHYVELTYLQDN
ncbi:TolC family protein [Catalinimonas niigatensis]|uniref:TolC family protein n=1 Tax=Catalinimonas niigatensis TaxID=1397264 RepID=UPI00266536DD|nr:TolC family protein [Catalinimonas niigatensis]WPP52825.1 TolC family protein [Catalinimonas niigatensis]